MRKLFLILILFTCIMGCDKFKFSNQRIPSGNDGKASQQDSTKQKVYGEMEGEFELPVKTLVDKSGIPFPPQKIRIDGVDAELPAGTKGVFKFSASGKNESYSFTDVSSTWKLNSAPVQLFVFGGIMVAGGVVLMFLGLHWLGIAISAGGGSLIACGVLINQFPWVVLIVACVCLIGIGYYLYTAISKKRLLGENKDTNFVLEELVDVVSDLPHEVLEKEIKNPLREHDSSDLIRKITRRARYRK